jgi:thioesterase domain-containing protein
MRPHGSSGEPIPATIEAMAAEHLAQIRALVPHGPYAIGGYCAGGFVAFEVAQRLRAAGECVADLVLVDVPNAPRLIRLIAGAIDRAATIVGLAPDARLRLGGRLARLPHHLSRFAASPSKVAFIAERVTRPLRRGRAATSTPPTALADWRRRAEAYVPRPYAGAVTLLLTRPAPGSAVGDRGGWRTNAPRVVCREIPGTHMSCITEFLDDTARAIATALQSEVE